VSEMAKQDIRICIDAYLDPDADVFLIGAADDILRLLADTHDTEFSIPELIDATGVTRSTVWRTVDLLDSIGAIQIRETPQRNYVAIDPDRLQKDDPILAVPQSEFHAPIRAFVDRVQATTTDTDDSPLADSSDVVADLQSEEFGGDRFVFEPYVESAESAGRAGSKLREIFAEGITVSGSDRLNALRKEVVADE
jgi:HTH domain.